MFAIVALIFEDCIQRMLEPLQYYAPTKEKQCDCCVGVCGSRVQISDLVRF